MKIDCHVHSVYSYDAIAKPEELVKRAKQRGLDGFALTDHNTVEGIKKVDEVARKYGLLFIPGEEVMIFENGKRDGELVVLFVSEKINPGTTEEVIDQANAQDAVVVVAHPYSWIKVPEKALQIAIKRNLPVEVFNSRNFLAIMNQKALQFAHSNKLPQTGGSDAHFAAEVGNGYTECDASDLEEFRKSLRGRRTRGCGIKSNVFYRFLGPLIKVGLLKRF